MQGANIVIRFILVDGEMKILFGTQTFASVTCQIIRRAARVCKRETFILDLLKPGGGLF
jgi:hypothetical protein